MQEFICSDGRMSVNGICAVDQQKNSVDSTQDTKDIINISDKMKNDKVLDDLAKDGTPDFYPDLGTMKKSSSSEKKSFSWDMDKPSSVKDFNSTIAESISAYNSFVEENLGISAKVQNATRVGSSVYALSTGSTVAALGPFALPFLAGNAMKGKELDRIQTIGDQDPQGKIKKPIDMMTYDIPTVSNYQDYGSGGASEETQASYEGADGSYAGASTQDYGGGE